MEQKTVLSIKPCTDSLFFQPILVLPHTGFWYLLLTVVVCQETKLIIPWRKGIYGSHLNTRSLLTSFQTVWYGAIKISVFTLKGLCFVLCYLSFNFIMQLGPELELQENIPGKKQNKTKPQLIPETFFFILQVLSQEHKIDLSIAEQ